MRYELIFCDNLREIRKKQGLTQEILAEMAEVDPKNLGRIERQEVSPSLNTIAKICEALEISPATLFKKEKEAGHTTTSSNN